MRILHIIPTLQRGGAERLCMDICVELSQRPGIEVQLVVLNDRIEYQTGEEVAPRVIVSRVQLSLLRKNRLQVDALRDFMYSFQPDIIHSHLLEAEIVSRSVDYPKATWFSHGHWNMRQLRPPGPATLLSKQAITEWYERSYLIHRYRKNGGNRFIAISKDTEAYLRKVLPADLRQVYLLHNAINLARFEKPRQHIRQKRADLELISVGSLVENKNQTFLVDVVKRLQQKKYNVHLTLLGDGPQRSVLAQQIAKAGLDNHMTLAGAVQHVEQYLWNSDLYVHAARSEAFGLVLVEAMAAGLPVVCIDAGGNRDIIRHQKNGFLLPVADVGEFADKIGLLFHDTFRYAQMKAAALETAQQFGIKPYTDQLLRLYQQALAGL